MTSVEKKIIHWIEEHVDVLFLIIIAILGLLIRSCNLDNESSDAQLSLLPWFETIKANGGMAALGENVGDYPIVYQFLIALITYLPFDPLRMYKYLSILFDYVLAFGTMGFLYDLTERRSKLIPLAGYAIVLFLPTVWANSAIIAQCDVIYSAFCVLAAWMMYRKNYAASFILLGCGFSFKLQAVFLLPFFLMYYIREKKFSILHFLIIPVVYYISCLPALLQGRSWLDPIRIYLIQSGKYDVMYLTFPSFWQLFSDNWYIFKNPAVILTIAIFGVMLLVVMKRRIGLTTRFNFLALLAWSAWTCVLFLPSMHERYGYLVDILLIILALIYPSCAGFSAAATCSSIICVGCAFFGLSFDIKIVTILYFGAYCLFTYRILKKLLYEEAEP